MAVRAFRLPKVGESLVRMEICSTFAGRIDSIALLNYYYSDFFCDEYYLDCSAYSYFVDVRFGAYAPV